jgi:rhamnosyltransferase
VYFVLQSAAVSSVEYLNDQSAAKGAVRGSRSAHRHSDLIAGLDAPRPAGRDVCAVLVTYHPNAEFSARLGEISRQVDAVIIVDNGSTDAERRRLRDLAADPAVELIFNIENLGIARGLNIGVQRAIGLGYRWALLLDQDSRVDGTMVDSLLKIQETFPEGNRLAVIGSGFRDVRGESPAAPNDQEPDGTPWKDVQSVITSGSLLSLAAYSVIGTFREEFFIDRVDFEYCLRAKARGYCVIQTRKPLMSHTIGTPTAHRLLWRTKWTTNHPADRRYYIARNDTVMLREYGNYVAVAWVLKSLERCLRQCRRIALYEDDKAGKIFAVAEGWWDGVRGKMGVRRRRPSSSGSPTVTAAAVGPREACRRR